MKKRGFTLVELLAIIIILGVLALISTPIVTSLIEVSKKGTYVKSIEGLVEAVKLDLGSNNFNKNREYELDSDDNNFYLIKTNGEQLAKREKIRTKGLVEGIATVVVDSDGDILVAATNEKWCVRNSKSDATLVLSSYTGSCNIETNATGNNPTGNYEAVTVSASPEDWSTSKTVTVTGIIIGSQLQYKIGSGSWTNITSGETFTLDSNNTIYGRLYDGTNEIDPVSIIITKIDTTAPELTLGAVSTTTSTLTIPISTNKDDQSGIVSTTCEYGLTTSYGSTGTISSNNCTITGLTNEQTYYYRISTVNGAGVETANTGNAKATSIYMAY